jgi:plasmid stability protein
MSQLLVRNLDASIVRKLKRRAEVHGVSAEEEHRRILHAALDRAAPKKPTLAAFLLSDAGVAAADVELDISRSRKIESHRDLTF